MNVVLEKLELESGVVCRKGLSVLKLLPVEGGSEGVHPSAAVTCGTDVMDGGGEGFIGILTMFSVEGGAFCCQ